MTDKQRHNYRGDDERMDWYLADICNTSVGLTNHKRVVNNYNEWIISRLMVTVIVRRNRRRKKIQER